MNSNSTPEFGGECAFALSTGKSGVPGSAKHSLADGDKTYHFSNSVARLLWKMLPNRAEKASAAWTG
jgi:hypothetical protein